MTFRLSDDHLLYVFSFFSGSELLLNLSLVCQSWKQLASSEILWKERCHYEKLLLWKPNSWSWKSLYKEADPSKICPHLNDLCSPLHLSILGDRIGTVHERDAKKQKLCHGENCDFGINNIWLCASPDCTWIGCGRRDNVHSQQHYKATEHPLILKPTTLEIFCYTCQQWLGANPIVSIRLEEISNYLFPSIPEKCFDLYKLRKRREAERNWVDPNQDEDIYAFVERNWWKQFERFIIGDTGPPTTSPDNTLFLNHDQTWLHPQALPEISYIVITKSRWLHLQSVYGGGPHVFWHRFKQKFAVIPVDEFTS